MDFRILDHTADLGLEASGKTLKEAFANAACGLFAILVENRGVSPITRFEVKLEAANAEELLVAWLNRLIYLHDSEQVVLGQFNIMELDDTHLIAEVAGEAVNPKKHSIQTYVKAATHHQVNVQKNGDYKIKVYFDV